MPKFLYSVVDPDPNLVGSAIFFGQAGYGILVPNPRPHLTFLTRTSVQIFLQNGPRVGSGSGINHSESTTLKFTVDTCYLQRYLFA
jgi:hypothetical protein